MGALRDVLDRVRGLSPEEQVREVCEVTHTINNLEAELANTPEMEVWMTTYGADILRWRSTVTDEDHARWNAKRKG